MKNYHFPSLQLSDTRLLLGLGETGVAVANWCLAHGTGKLRIADTRAEHTQARSYAQDARVELCLGEHALALSVLDGVSQLVLSPGLSPLQAGVAELLAEAKQRGIPVVNEITLFMQALVDLAQQGYQPKLLAITGTNGKTTVTALTRHMLTQAGWDTVAAGNISPAALTVLEQRLHSDALPQAWVLELSSFQLESVGSLPVDAAVVLNVSQDHLDWHGSFAAYTAAKAAIYAQAKIKVVNNDDAAVVAMVPDLTQADVRVFSLASPTLVGDMGVTPAPLSFLSVAVGDQTTSTARTTGQPQALLPLDMLAIHGRHNVSNALAALALCEAVDAPLDAVLEGLSSYRGEPHRAELVRVVRGVRFINDSKGTNVSATVAALTGIEGPVVLIAGGVGKGQDFSPLAQAVQLADTQGVVLIGQDAARIQMALSHTDVTAETVATLEEAVSLAFSMLSGQGVVLLSPACASLDMFVNYEQRGHVFVDAVTTLALDLGEVA